LTHGVIEVNIINQNLDTVDDILIRANAQHRPGKIDSKTVIAKNCLEYDFLNDLRTIYYEYILARFGFLDYFKMVKIHKTI
jgi:hypothetical protein